MDENQNENVDVEGAAVLIGQGALLLDVREDDEWEAGHAPTARHVALSSVPDVLDDLSTGQTVICVCRSGARSARAARFLREHGVRALNLDGGMIAWHAAGAEMLSDAGEPHVA